MDFRDVNRFRWTPLWMAALGVAGCASAPQTPIEAPPARADFRVDGSLPQPDRAPAPLFASGLRLDAAGGVFLYEADYQFQPGAMFGTAGPVSEGAIGSRIGEQAMAQRFNWSMAEFAGAPLKMGLSYQQQDQWSRTGPEQQAQRQVGLSWAPVLASFDLQWVGSTSAAAPLDCPLQGSMRVPLGAADSALRLGGRDCRVVMPDLSRGGNARTWSAALEWGAAERSSALRALAIDPVAEQSGPDVDVPAGYELGASQQIPVLGWQAQASAAWQRPPGELAEGGWTTDAKLKREVRNVGVSAGMRRGLNSYWFMPEAAQKVDQYELGLDLSRWAKGLAPGLQPAMGMAYQWTPGATPKGGIDDSSLNWTFSLNW
jgi:hypothetical protein